MKPFFRCCGLFAIVLAISAFTWPVSARQDQQPSIEQLAVAKQWSLDVWRAAMQGDQPALDQYFKAPPNGEQFADIGTRFHQSLQQYQSNLEKSKSKRDESREKALKEMREHIEAGDLSKALRAAVTVQTLSDTLDVALTDPDIIKIVEWAKTQIPQVEEKLDWLQAQELLYYLRTLFEDTSQTAQYAEYNKQLDWVNRRVSLLAQYAPKRLWELRVARAERMGDKALGEYKPPVQADWKARFDGVRVEMLKQALKVAADEHIEDKGWRPLLIGGLQELKILATTASLDETFPNLRDVEIVGRWVGYLDEQTQLIEQSKDNELDSWTLTHILDGLVKMNDQTVKLDKQVLYREFGDGAMYELDQFSEIIWPDKLSRFKQATEGNFVGVGILIRHNDTQDIVVVNPLEGTPAYFGGVKPNDVIAEVDGESTVGWSLNDAVDRITGTRETKVTLGLKREGAEDLIPLTLERKEIKLHSVMGWWKKNLDDTGTPMWDWYIDPAGRIAYVRITQFTENTVNDLKIAWNEMRAQGGNPAGLILDLRFNPGGLLTAAVDVSRMFVRNGVIVSGEDKDGRKAWADQKADPTHLAMEGVPTVVLVNQGSASASEIVSGCLQAHHAAVVLGERSFGKGSVQTVHQTAQSSRLKLTTQYYRLPDLVGPNGEIISKGRLVHKRPGADDWGVKPDMQVKMSPDQITDSLELRQKADIIPQDETGELKPDDPDRPEIAKLLLDGLDPQLETALLLLKARALGETASDQDTRHVRRDE